MGVGEPALTGRLFWKGSRNATGWKFSWRVERGRVEEPSSRRRGVQVCLKKQKGMVFCSVVDKGQS